MTTRRVAREKRANDSDLGHRSNGPVGIRSCVLFDDIVACRLERSSGTVHPGVVPGDRVSRHDPVTEITHLDSDASVVRDRAAGDRYNA